MKRVVMPIAILAGCILFAGYLIYTPIELEEAAPEVHTVTVRVAEVKLDSVQLVWSHRARYRRRSKPASPQP